MKNFFFELLVITFLAVFKVLDSITVTPSYKITYRLDGSIAYAQCKKTGKFVKHALAKAEINSYFVGA